MKRSIYKINESTQLIHQHKSQNKLVENIKKHSMLYIMALPVILYFIIFKYIPMYGMLIAFERYVPSKGIFGSPWVGFEHFKAFFNDAYFWRLIRNTLLISIYQLVFGFPVPVIFALLLNEVKNKAYKKTVQTITYMPHFISAVVVCGLVVDFTSSRGVVTDIVSAITGMERSNLLAKPELFRPIYVIMNIWKGFGWGSIVYLAALSGIDPNLYEAATIDGANRWKQALHITLPGIAPTIIILLILRMGRLMSIGWQNIILLYSPMTYETADVLSTYVYRRGLIKFDYSYSTAVDIFNAVVNVILLTIANKISRKVSETSLW